MTSAVAPPPGLSTDSSTPSVPAPAPTANWPQTVLGSQITQAIGVAVLFTAVTWMPMSIIPTSGLDASWGAGLAMAFVHHILWGPGIDFTYGPLGFLSQPTLYFGSTAAMATAFLVATDVGMFALLILWWRKSFPLPVALVPSYLIGATAGALIDPGDRIMVVITLFGLWLLRRDEGRWQLAGIGALGILTAVALLEKVSDGVIAIVILAVVALASRGGPRARGSGVGIAAGSLLVTAIVAWVFLGDSLGDLPVFVRYAAATSSGYSSAMQLESGRTLEWWLAGLIAVTVLVVAIVSLRHESRRIRLGYAVILLGVSWWALKEGFVRHDAHDLVFFGFMLIVLSTLSWSANPARIALTGAVALSTLAAWIAFASVPANLYQLPHDANALRSQITSIVSTGTRDSTIRDARRAMRHGYRLNAAQLRRLRGQTVAIQPWENAAAWAYTSFTWDPEPVLQAYSAYTPSLDKLDASFLQSKQAPTRILVQPGESVDGRYPYFEPPSTWVAMACRYTQLDASKRWQVLERVPNRCGPPTMLSHTSASFGQRVVVPPTAPGMLLVASFTDLPLTLRYKAASLLLKPPTASIDTSTGNFRFIVGTAGDLHVMRAATTLGYAAGYAPASLDWISLNGAGVEPSHGHYDVTFYELSMGAA